MKKTNILGLSLQLMVNMETLQNGYTGSLDFDVVCIWKLNCHLPPLW